MDDVAAMLAVWGLDVGQVRRRIYRATDARKRERWHALWLLAHLSLWDFGPTIPH